MLPLDSQGMIGNALTGCELAWRHRRQLLPVLLATIVPASVVLYVVELLSIGTAATIIDGAFVFDDGSGLKWVRVPLMASAWLIALTAGTVIVVAGARGTKVATAKALSAAVRAFPVLAASLVVLCGFGLLATWLVSGAVGGRGGFGFALSITAVVVLVMLAARTLVGIPARVFGGSAWRLTRDRVGGTAGAFVLGGLVVPLLLAYVRDQVRPHVFPVVTDLVDTVLMVGVVAAQAGILGFSYLQRRDAPESSEGSSADLDTVDSRLATLAGAPWRRSWAGVALLVPALLSMSLVGVNPFGVPVVRTDDGVPSAMAVAWPPGGHPVIVTSSSVRFCDDDLCHGYVVRLGGPTLTDGYGTAGFGADGSVVRAVVTGGEDTGGPFIHAARCTRRDGCREAWVPVRASAAEPFAYPELAVSAAPDGAIWFALASAPTGRDRTALALIRCADIPCARPERHTVGSVAGGIDHSGPNRHHVELSIGADGRPTAWFRVGGTHTATCEPVSCATPRVTATGDGPGTVWTVSDDGRVAWLGSSGLYTSDRGTQPVEDADRPSTAIAATDSGIYAVYRVGSAAPSGLHVGVGGQPEYWRWVLWQCPGQVCDQVRRLPLDVVEGRFGPVRLAVGADGSVLIVRDDRILLVPPL